MNNQFNLEISSNADCNIYNGNDFLFALKAYCSTKISIEKANIKLRVFDIDNQSKLHQIDYDFTSDYYRIFIDLIAIIKARKFIENFKPIVKKEYERGSRSYWEKERIDKSFQFIYGYELYRSLAKGHDPNSDFEDGYAMISFRSNDSNEYYGFRTDYQFINKLGNVVSGYVGNNVSGPKGNNIVNNADGIAVVFNNNKYGFVNLRTEKIFECKYDKAFSFKDDLACVQYNGKYGFIDKNENVVIDFKYQEASKFNENLSCVKLESKFGYIDKNGLVILPFIYDKATSFCNTIAKVIINEKHYIIDIFGNKSETVDFDSIIECDNKIALVKKSSRNILIDKNGKVVLENTEKSGMEVFEKYFSSWGKCVDGLRRVTDVNEKNGYINTEGQIVISFIYEYADDFYNGFACIRTNNKYSFIDTQGIVVIDLFFEYISNFSEGLACVRRNNKYGYIDRNGIVVIDCIFENGFNFSDGLARVLNNNKYGFIDKNGTLVIDFIYENADDFSKGLASVEKNNKCNFINKKGDIIASNLESITDPLAELPFVKWDGWNGRYGFIDKNGRDVIQFNYVSASEFSEGYACVATSGNDYRSNNYIFIDKNGENIFERHFYSASSFSEGLACCKNDKFRYGYIDNRGNNKIPFSFAVARDFSEGLASVITNDKYGYIDNSGKEIIPIEFDEIFNFIGEYAKVNINGMYGIIDNKGKLIIPAIYESIKHCASDFFIVQKKEYYLCKNWGVIDINHNIILPFGFDEITLLNNNFLKVSIRNKFGLYNQNFEELFPPKYDQIIDFENNVGRVILNGYWGLIDSNGMELVSPNYEKIHDFVTEIVRIKSNNWNFDFNDDKGYNLISKKDIYVEKYRDVINHSIGLPVLKYRNSLWGYVDKFGNEVIECKYNEALSFSEGLACVKLDDKYGYINTKGDVILDFIYYDANNFKCGYSLVAVRSTNTHLKGELIGLIYPEDEEYDLEGLDPLVDTDKIYIDQNGIELKIKPIAEIYDLENNLMNSSDSNYYEITDATDFYEGYARIKIKGIWRLLDTQGNFY